MSEVTVAAAAALRLLGISILLGGCIDPAVDMPPETTLRDSALTVIRPTLEIHPDYAWLRFAVPDTNSKIYVSYGRLGGNETRSVPSGDGSHREVLLGFLQPATAYEYSLSVEPPEGTQIITERFFTPSSKNQWADPRGALVLPGSRILVGNWTIYNFWCTLGFVLRDSTNSTLYAVTAGHCAASGVGDAARIERIGANGVALAGPVFGKVVAAERYEQGSREPITPDWALVAIDPKIRPLVSPSVNHWTGPSGNISRSDVRQGEVVCYYGWGTGFHAAEETRHRCGSISGRETREYRNQSYDVIVYRGQASSGDSGSPILEYETGRAVGLVHSLSTAGLGFEGTALYSIIDRVRLSGYDLEVATHPFGPPPRDGIATA